jgi:hypothetical protein
VRLPQPKADLHSAADFAGRDPAIECAPQNLHGLFTSTAHLGGLAPQLEVVRTELPFGVGGGELGAGLRPARRCVQLACLDQPIRSIQPHIASISHPAVIG